MSKTFVLKRNPSQDGTGTHRSPEGRTKSLSREGSTAYNSHYFNPDFGMDGSVRRCPVHDIPRDAGHYGSKPSNDRHHSNYPSNWTSVVTSNPRYVPQSTYQGESSQSSPRSRRSSPGTRHKDLKRKMVFDLHKEIRKPIHTTPLEEISDMDRITEICMSTLKSMMESKKHRKFLHHMNNNNQPMQYEIIAKARPKPYNASNNADKRKQMAGRLVGQIYLMSKRRDSGKHDWEKLPRRMSGLSEEEEEMPEVVKNMPSKFHQVDEDPTDVGRSAFSQDRRRMSYAMASATQSRRASSVAPSNMGGVDRKGDEDIPNPISGSRDAALKLLADISAKIEKQSLEEEMQDGRKGPLLGKRKVVPPITPEEALNCAWLRLSKEQILCLEQLMRDEGKVPDIHPHSDLTNYDLFDEIRTIRQQEKLAKQKQREEEEQDGDEDDDEPL